MQNAAFINKVVPGASIPNEILSRLENSSDPMKDKNAQKYEELS